MKKYFWIFFILIISSQVTKSQTYFSLTADSSNLTYTGIETDLTFHIKLHNSTGSLQNYIWIRSNPCLMPNGWSALVCDCQACYNAATFTASGTALDSCLNLLEYMFAFGADVGTHTTQLTFYNPADSLNSTTTATYTVNYGCAPSGIPTYQANSYVIYPIPCNDFLHIELQGASSPLDVEIQNSIGMTLLRSKVFSNGQLSTTNLAPGFYILKIKDSFSGKSTNMKFEKR